VAGIGTLILLQAIINISVAVGLLPVTGQTLPFISYGGSAYFFLGLGLGVIQAVAFDNKKQARQQKKDSDKQVSQHSDKQTDRNAGDSPTNTKTSPESGQTPLNTQQI
jgi:cell division protein FtsW